MWIPLSHSCLTSERAVSSEEGEEFSDWLHNDTRKGFFSYDQQFIHRSLPAMVNLTLLSINTATCKTGGDK